jgi:hypothetical protein
VLALEKGPARQGRRAPLWPLSHALRLDWNLQRARGAVESADRAYLLTLVGPRGLVMLSLVSGSPADGYP